MSSNEPSSSSSTAASSSVAETSSSSSSSRSASSDNPDELTPVESSHYRDGPGNLLAVVSMGAEEGEEEMVKVVAEAAIDDATSCAAVFEGFRGTAAVNMSADRFVQCLRDQEALPWPSMRLQTALSQVWTLLPLEEFLHFNFFFVPRAGIRAAGERPAS